MADSQRLARKTPVTKISFELCGQEAEICAHTDGKFYTNIPHIKGPFDSFEKVTLAIGNMFGVDRSNRGPVTPEEPRTAQAYRSIRRDRGNHGEQEAEAEDTPSDEEVVADIAQFTSEITLHVPNDSSFNIMWCVKVLDDYFAASPQTEPDASIVGSADTFPFRSEEVAGGPLSASALAVDVSSSEELPYTTKLEESITASPQTELHTTIDDASIASYFRSDKLVADAPNLASLQQQMDSLKPFFDPTAQEESTTAIDGSSSTSPFRSKELVAEIAESTSALTLHEFDDSPSKQLLNTTALEASITASPQRELRTASDSSWSTFPFRSEQLVDGCTQATSAINMQQPTNINGSPQSDLGSKILIRRRPNWYQTHLVRMDRSGSFWTYPDLGGPFQSIYEAEDAINCHFDELHHQAMLKKQDNLSLVDRLIQKHNFYPDGTPKRGPDSPGKVNTARDEHYLAQALTDQYNEDHNLLGNLAHNLEKVVKKTWIIEEDVCYCHLNFTTKTKEDNNSYLFFAEVSRVRQLNVWDVTCCHMIDSNKDKGHCFGCKNNGSPDMMHPNDTSAYTGGHLNKYLPFGEDKTDIAFDNLEAEDTRLRALFKGFTEDTIERIHALADDMAFSAEESYSLNENHAALCRPSPSPGISTKKDTKRKSPAEVSWKSKRLHEKNIMPKSVRNQHGPTCVFHALSATAEIERKRDAALLEPPKSCDIYFHAGSLLRDYEKIAGKLGSAEEKCDETRRSKCLCIMKNKGIFASQDGGCLRTRVRISDSEWLYDPSTADMIDILNDGKPVVGAIPIDETFLHLGADEIYDFDVDRSLLVDDSIAMHAVVFVGYGMCDGRLYLVFLNSWGSSWADGGYGRVFFDHVDRLNTISF